MFCLLRPDSGLGRHNRMNRYILLANYQYAAKADFYL